jgi:hypothetical protein
MNCKRKIESLVSPNQIVVSQTATDLRGEVGMKSMVRMRHLWHSDSWHFPLMGTRNGWVIQFALLSSCSSRPSRFPCVNSSSKNHLEYIQQPLSAMCSCDLQYSGFSMLVQHWTHQNHPVSFIVNFLLLRICRTKWLDDSEVWLLGFKSQALCGLGQDVWSLWDSPLRIYNSSKFIWLKWVFREIILYRKYWEGLPHSRCYKVPDTKMTKSINHRVLLRWTRWDYLKVCLRSLFFRVSRWFFFWIWFYILKLELPSKIL